ncbi:MAG TPA: limonene-1,2-epoxide hydrolase [Lactobacillus sp.]|nr:limonene-1,2-epoxide hydrolase [Lactobacillus sp.]
MSEDQFAYKPGTEAFFNVVMDGLKGEVDADNFWEAVDENAVFEFMYNIDGFTNKIEGRQAYMDWFAGYSAVLTSADGLRVYKDREKHAVTLEYAVHGTVPSTGKHYDNHFCSIVIIKNRKIVRWYDYMDTMAVMTSNTPDATE